MAARRSNALRIVMSAVEGSIARTVVRTTLNVVANLTAAPSEGGTPVDTGWARANWIPSIGKPLTAPVGSPLAVTSGPQQSALALVASAYRLPAPIYVGNNVPYISLLNAGSSRQAPAGFVEAAILRALRQQAGAAA